jgi:hypothetical protein
MPSAHSPLQPAILRKWCPLFGLALLLALPVRSEVIFDDLIREPETEAALNEAISAEYPRIFEALRAAVSRVITDTEDPDLETQTADWLLSVGEKLADSLSQDDPEAALRDSWIILRQAEASLESDSAVTGLGDARFILMDGAENARSRIVAIARKNLAREPFNRLRNIAIQEERRRVSQDPGHRGFFGYGKRSETEEGRGLLLNVIAVSERTIQSVPGVPVAESALSQTFGFFGDAARFSGRAVGGVAEGVGTASGLGGIENLSQTLRQFPTDARENTTLILENENYRATLQSIDGFSESTGRVAEAVERLPGEISGTIAKFAETQPELRGTIQESDTAIKSAEAMLAQAERASVALEAALIAAGEATEVATLFLPTLPPEERVESPEPFRMERVTEAAEAAGVTMVELKAAVLALHELLNDPQLPQLASTAADESKGILDHGATASRKLVDHITIRVLLLVAGILIMILLYHIARFYMMRALVRRSTPDGTAGESA